MSIYYYIISISIKQFEYFIENRYRFLQNYWSIFLTLLYYIYSIILYLRSEKLYLRQKRHKDTGILKIGTFWHFL